MHRRIATIALVALVLGFTAASRAQAGIGVHAGFSVNPDQVVVGVHNNLSKEVIPGTRVVLPIVELARGDHFTRLTGAGGLVVMLPEIGDWQLYAGGDMALHLSFRNGDNKNDLGVDGIVGIEKPASDDALIGFELKLGFVDSPDLEMLVSYTFGSRKASN